MTINERIRFLRKEHLKMSQVQFALLIGMKQTSVSTFEKKGATVTEQTIKSICLVVDGLNEDWLRNGNGKMFIENGKKQKKLSNIFNKLSPEFQDHLLKTAKDLLKTQHKMQINNNIMNTIESAKTRECKNNE